MSEHREKSSRRRRKPAIIDPNQPAITPMELLIHLKNAMKVMDQQQQLHRKKIGEHEGSISTLQSKVSELYDRVKKLEDRQEELEEEVGPQTYDNLKDYLNKEANK